MDRAKRAAGEIHVGGVNINNVSMFKSITCPMAASKILASARKASSKPLTTYSARRQFVLTKASIPENLIKFSLLPFVGREYAIGDW
jgi:hypothetical protein